MQRSLTAAPVGSAPASPAEEWLGSFRLGRLIGEGDVTRVFAAEHRMLGGGSAVKVLHPELAARPELAEAFLRLSRYAAGLPAHPALVPLLDSGHCGAGPYLAYELLAGEILLSRVQGGGPHGRLADIERIVHQLAACLAEVHAAGACHGDLHPGNIFLCSGPEGSPACRVTDLGTGAFLAACHGVSPVWRQRSSPARHYLAPEVLRDPRALGPAADVFSLGVILFQGLTGELPMPSGGVLPTRALGDRAPLIERMLRERPAERPGMREIAEALGQARLGAYVLSRQVSHEGGAVLYEATHLPSGQRGLLRVISGAARSPAEMLGAARNLQRIQDPAFARILDCGELERGQVYLFLEPLPQGSLGGHVKQARIGQRAYGLAAQLARALSAAHEQGVLHLGLHPDGLVLVRGPAGEDQIKILDSVATARRVDQHPGATRRTLESFPVDRPSAPVLYLAPEQCGAPGAISEATDVYSLGAVLFFLLSGESLFQAEQLTDQIAAQQRDAAPRSVRDFAPESPPQADALLRRMLAKDPRSRPTLGEVIFQLTCLETVARVLAQPPPTPYQIQEPLHFGGMGIVFGGRRSPDGARVAIKVPLPQLAAARQKKEIQAARLLQASDDPGLLRVLDTGRLLDETEFLVMEFLEGEDLATRLERERTLPETAVLALCVQASGAMAAAHALSVIHRDLTPENLMLVRGPGGQEQVKVVDFGIAHVAAEYQREQGCRLTRVGVRLGKDPYMAPEQWRDAGSVTGKADVYSLGVVLYQALSGGLPPPPPPPQVASPGTMALLLRMLDVSPDRRPTMAEVQIEALALLRGPAPPPPSRAPLWIAAVVAAIACAGAYGATRLPLRYEIAVDQDGVMVVPEDGGPRLCTADREAPCKLRRDRRKGAMAVWLEKQGFQRKRLVLDPQGERDVQVQLRPARWELRATPQGAQITVQGVRWGKDDTLQHVLATPEVLEGKERPVIAQDLRHLRVRATKGGYVSVEKDLDSMADQREEIALHRPEITIRSTPDKAAVLAEIGGAVPAGNATPGGAAALAPGTAQTRWLGETPLKLRLADLPEGTRRLQVVARDRGEGLVDLREAGAASEDLSYDLVLPPLAVVRLALLSTPAAQIFRLDSGDRVGTTPFRGELRIGASLELELRRPGYVSERVSVRAEPPYRVEKTVALRAVPRGPDPLCPKGDPKGCLETKIF